MSIIVGVAGGSGAGKSTLLAHLVGQLPESRVIDLDSYYLDRGHLPANARKHLNYDEPAAFDLPLLMEQLRRLAAGGSIEKPKYSFANHRRIGACAISPAPVIVVEGLFTLWWPEIRALLDVALFVDAPADVRLLRRLTRDVAERGRTVESVAEQYLLTVRPMHERYVEPSKGYADHVIDNSGAVDNAVDQALRRVLSLLKVHLSKSEVD